MRGERQRPRPGADTRHLAGEVAALDDGGDVGAVVGEDSFEHVARSGVIGAFGDDEKPVRLPPACGGDVEAAVAGGLSDDGDPDVDGVGAEFADKIKAA